MVQSPNRATMQVARGESRPKGSGPPFAIPKRSIRMMPRCNRGKLYVAVVSCDGFCGINHTPQGGCH